VARAVPELTFPTTALDPSGTPAEAPWDGPTLGHSWESAVLGPYALRSGHAPTGDMDVVLDSALAGRLGSGAGDTVRLIGPSGPRTYRISGVAESPLRETRQYAVFHTPREGRRLAGSAEPVRAIGVLGRPGTDPAALRRQVARQVSALYGDSGAPVVIASGAGRAEAESWDLPTPADTLSSFVGTFGVLALFVAGFAVSGTLSLAVAGRLTEIGLLRAVAATRGQIRRVIAAEALVVTLAAALVGVPAGIGTALLLHRVLVAGEVLPPSFRLSLGPVAPGVTVALAVAVAQLASFAAARRASRVRPVEVLRESAAPTRRTGWLRILIGVSVFVWAGTVLHGLATGRRDAGGGTGEGMVLVLMVGVALLAPLICRAAGALLLVPVKPFLPFAGVLAVRNLRGRNARLTAVVTPLVLAVSLSGTLLCAPLIKSAGAERADRERVRADHVVTSTGPGLPGAYAERAARLPGVAAASGLLSVDGELSRADGDENLDAGGTVAAGTLAIRADAVPQLLDLGVRTGSFARFDEGSLALGDDAARSLGAGVGDRVRVDWDDGARDTFRVAAVYARDDGFAEALLPRGRAARHAALPLEETVLVRTAPGAERGAVERQLKDLGADFPTARVDGEAGSGTSGSGEAAADLFTLVLLAMLTAFTAVTVVNTLALATASRRREFALLRLAGARPAQVVRMLAWEAVLTCAIALLQAALVTASVLVPLSVSLTGSPHPALAGGPLTALALGAAMITVGTVVFAGRAAMRRDPVPYETQEA